MEIIKNTLQINNINSLHFDGKLSREQKENVLYNYINTSIPVLILQINCGSVGLNLQCASHIIITSPNWNPTIDLQAIGRSHRKGQTKEVSCLRLVMKNTIEERCLEVSDSKTNIIEDIMKDDSMKKRLGINNPDLTLNITDVKKMFNLSESSSTEFSLNV
jgi:SNF2 family DNA or RNA helicase